MADLNVAPLRSLSQAAQDLYILASPQSPMRQLLASISRQLTLSIRARRRAAALPQHGRLPTQRLSGRLGSKACSALRSLRRSGGTSAARPRGRRTLCGARDLLSGGADAPIDQVLLRTDAQQQIAKLAATLANPAPPRR